MSNEGSEEKNSNFNTTEYVNFMNSLKNICLWNSAKSPTEKCNALSVRQCEFKACIEQYTQSFILSKQKIQDINKLSIQQFVHDKDLDKVNELIRFQNPHVLTRNTPRTEYITSKTLSKILTMKYQNHPLEFHVNNGYYHANNIFTWKHDDVKDVISIDDLVFFTKLCL